MSKKLNCFFLALFILSGCKSSKNNNETIPRAADSLKVLSWNVWHAGHSKEYPQKGCNATKKILKKSNADIIIMIETYGCSNSIADYLGYYHRLLSDNLSIYSRYPIVRTLPFPDIISPYNFGGVELNVHGKTVRVFNTWLHYLPDIRLAPLDKPETEILTWDDAGSRDDEIKTIMQILQPFIAESDSIPIILGGDFNVHSHLDWTEATKNLYNHRGKCINWTVSQIMQKHGFIDSFREINPDPVKNLGPTWFLSDGGIKKRMDRIDFIYYLRKNIHAIRSNSYNADLGGSFQFCGEEYLYPSDHGFVSTTFKIH